MAGDDLPEVGIDVIPFLTPYGGFVPKAGGPCENAAGVMASKSCNGTLPLLLLRSIPLF